MTLHLHYAKPLSSEERSWLTTNRYQVDDNNWLDVTNYIRYFDKNRINDFIGLICEVTSLDLAFDKWEFR
jgi:hypothetical protein